MDDYRLRAGLVLPQGAHSELAGLDGTAAWRRLEDIATLGEKLGYHTMWAYDRAETLPRRDPYPVLDGWTVVAALARLTTRVRLGLISPAAPARNPVLLAKRAASVDVASGGRLTLALDCTGYPPEFAAHGLPDADLAARCRGRAETAEALRLLWADGIASYDGEFVRVRAAHCLPRPIQDPLPIMAVGEGPASPGPGWQGMLWEGDPGEIARLAGEQPGPGGARRAALLECRIFGSELERDRWLSSPNVIIFWSEHPDIYVHRNLIGTVPAVIAQLQRFVDAGIQEIAVFFRDYPETASVEALMTEVLPKVTLPG
jgi:alkanesulfonate monooxygenase SsuD/methylene tetrahydromethanopterin reductase-like flavin-dependent oxidoreductase (luciferase family)